jgi:hypothetical protein
MLQFPLTSSQYLRLDSLLVTGYFQKFLFSLTLTSVSFLAMTPRVKLIFFCGASVWVYSVLLCAFWVARAFLRQDFSVMWPIKVRALCFVCACMCGCAHLYLRLSLSRAWACIWTWAFVCACACV